MTVTRLKMLLILNSNKEKMGMLDRVRRKVLVGLGGALALGLMSSTALA
jgi:hypothetical protein